VLEVMDAGVDPTLLSLFGSQTRLLTMAVLANATEPLTGYRVAVIAGLPREKVYPEIRKGLATGLLTSTKGGYRMVDSDVRCLLQKRVQIRWDKEWDRERTGWNERTQDRLKAILASIPSDPTYLRPEGWKPPASARALIREMRRPKSKDALLRGRGLRTSLREGWVRER
jgi:hypothetical protein